MYQTTRWSLVQNAARNDPDGRLALDELCRIYRPAVLAYLRRSGLDRDTAQERTQSFFLHLLENDLPAKADPARGRFRVFLRCALQHHLAKLHEREQAQRRRPPGGIVGDDAIEQQDDAGQGNPELAFDMAWALTLLERSVERLRTECAERGLAAEFEALRPALTGGLDRGELDALAASLGAASNTIAMRLHRLRLRLRDAVRRELADTVSDKLDVDEELRHLRGLLGARGG